LRRAALDGAMARLEPQPVPLPTMPLAALHRIDVGIAITSPSGKLHWLNDPAAAMVGLPAGHSQGRSLPALLPGIPHTPGRAATVLGPIVGTGSRRWYEVRCRSLTDLPAEDFDGIPVDGARSHPDELDFLLYMITDITIWQERELEVAEREQALRRAQALGRLGSWEWFPDDGRVEWSDALREMLGVQPSTPLTYTTYASLVHPGDLGTLERTLANALRTGERFTVTHRIVTADKGTERVFECHGEVILADDGEPVQVVCIAHDITRSFHAQAELVRLAEQDDLTGLPNRRALTGALERHLASSGPGGAAGALLLLDVDNFKDVNDLHGHAAGDRVMRELATILSKLLRPGQALGRLGGDEFAVLVPDGTAAAALELGRRLRDAVAQQSVRIGGSLMKTTVSIGVAPFSAGHGWEHALANADLALYASKEAGRNRVTTYQDGHYTHTLERVSVLSRIRTAMDDDLLALHAMPIVDLVSGRTVSYELLLRLCDGLYPELAPTEFLAAVEPTDLILSVDRWVIANAVRALASRPERNTTFEVNVSGRTVEDKDFADFVLAQLSEAGVPADRLGLEITETAALTNIGAAQQLALRLRAAGCRLSLDDFGAGFGSFVHLKHLPVSGVKIDGEFVRGVDTSADDPVFVGAIVHMARGLGLTVVAEWVERQAQVGMLIGLGVTRAQGFHLGRPEPLCTLVSGNAPTAPVG
jgi:diguanylate cyclase (GGDEF)-like protein/PAS domain S-box-containing protein